MLLNFCKRGLYYSIASTPNHSCNIELPTLKFELVLESHAIAFLEEIHIGINKSVLTDVPLVDLLPFE